MVSQRQLFFQRIAQTSEAPLQLEVERADGIFIYTRSGKKYIDLLSGISVSNLGHGNPTIKDAVKKQVDKYMHVMVYGEYIQSPQVKYADLLCRNLPPALNCVYFVNSGSEATEGALKLAKRYTGRAGIVSFHNSYHGSTHGALSVLGDESFRRAFRPLLPGVTMITYNDFNDLNHITEKTACVIMEPIQAEAGMVIPAEGFLQAVRKRCDETGALLIFDEVQTGFGRTGKLFGFMRSGVVPDIMLLAKGMGGGMPIGAFVSSKNILDSFKSNPVLGHITTFGGHPVSCAAALASLQITLDEKLHDRAKALEQRIRKSLKHTRIKNIRGHGLLLAVDLGEAVVCKRTIAGLLERGIVTGDYLFNNTSFSISPPLIIEEGQLDSVCLEIIDVLDKL